MTAFVLTSGLTLTGLVWLRLRDVWRILYLLTLLLLFFATSTQEVLVSLSYYPRYGAAALLVAWTWLHDGRDARLLRECPAGVALLVHGLWLAVAFAAVSTIWSVDRFTTFAQTVALALLASLVHGLLTRRWTVQTRMSADLGAAVLLFAGLFLAGILAWLAGVPGTQTYGGRFQGLFSNPNTLGMIGALVLPVSLGLWRHTKSQLYLAAAVITAAAVVMSNSRTAATALILAGLWVLIRARNSRAIAMLLPITILTAGLSSIGLLMGVAVPAPVVSLLARFTANEGGDLLNSRDIAWVNARRLFLERPIEGYGYSAGPSLFSSQRDSGQLLFASDVVHNSYMQWLLELGLMGLVPLLLLLALFLRVLLARPTGALSGALQWLVLTGVLVQFTESAMFGTGQAYPFLFWVMVAAALVDKRHHYSGSLEPAPLVGGRASVR